MTMPQQPAPASVQSSVPLTHEFTAAGPIDLNVQNLRGAITLRAEHGAAVRVELSPHGPAGQKLAERLTVRFDQSRLTVDVPSDEFSRVGADVGGFFRTFGTDDGTPLSDRLADGVRSLVRGAEGLKGELDITVLVPAGSRAVLHDGAGDVRVHGALARLDARAGAGDLALERGADEGSRVSTGAGDISVGSSASDLAANTGTGDIRVDRAEGHVAMNAGIGDISVRRALSGRLTARSGLGDVTIHVAPGTATRLDLATGFGERDVQLDPTDGAGEAERTLMVEAKSGKGDLRILRADA